MGFGFVFSSRFRSVLRFNVAVAVAFGTCFTFALASDLGLDFNLFRVGFLFSFFLRLSFSLLFLSLAFSLALVFVLCDARDRSLGLNCFVRPNYRPQIPVDDQQYQRPQYHETAVVLVLFLCSFSVSTFRFGPDFRLRCFPANSGTCSERTGR